MTTAKKKDPPAPAESAAPAKAPAPPSPGEPAMFLCVHPEGGAAEIFFGTYEGASRIGAVMGGVVLDLSALPVVADFRSKEPSE